MPVSRSSYLDILRSTSLIGGSSAIALAFGLLRGKAMALLLGPGGVGLLGLYTAIADLTQALAGMGIQNSGVRQIAEAAGSDDTARTAARAIVLKRVSVVLGLAGAAAIVVLAGPVSQLTFGSGAHAAAVALLSAVVFLRLVSAGQAALLQGRRRIAAFARMMIAGAGLGTVISIPIVFVLRDRGVVPSLIAMAAASLLASWWYSREREPRHEQPTVTLAETMREAAGLLSLGLAFMASSVLTIGAAYAVRLILLRSLGFEAAGLYQAAWAVGGLYVGFILQSMGADFYPRLTAVCTDDRECNRLVNEQTYISLLLAGPGVLATLTCAPLVIAVLYSSQFEPAVSLLRWLCLGMMLRVLAWPIGYIVVAKGEGRLFFWTELAATAVHVGLAWVLVRRYGLDGSGAAFAGLYAWHTAVIYAVAARLSGFQWTATTRRTATAFLGITGAVFAGFAYAPPAIAIALGATSTVLTTVFSLRAMIRVLPTAAVSPALRGALVRLRLASSESLP